MFTTANPLRAKASKIVAGQEPEKTNSAQNEAQMLSRNNFTIKRQSLRPGVSTRRLRSTILRNGSKMIVTKLTNHQRLIDINLLLAVV